MPTGTFQYQTEAERLAIETAIAFVAEMHQLALAAPDGQVLSLCEQQALDQGRSLLRSTLQHAVQARIDAAEKKGGPRVSAACVPTTRAGVCTTNAAVRATC